MENENKINWLSLFIKIVIIFIFVIIVIWLISKIIGNKKLSEKFINNINNMEKASIEYFKTIDLPLTKGKSNKITLEELLEKELIVSEENETTICDVKESYSKITREKKNYVVSTTLKCGKEKDTIKEKFSFKDCKNCNNKESEEKNEELQNSSTQSNKNNNIQYEYVKENISYSKWIRGDKTGNNIENKYEYYSISEYTYYSLVVISKNKNSLTYTLLLKNVPNKNYYFSKIEEINYFNSEEENYYLNEDNISIFEGDKVNIKNNISEYTLREGHFTYKLYPYYRQGSFYTRVTINIKNTDGIKPYYDNKLKDYVYIIPLKFTMKFMSDKPYTTKPKDNYEMISYYRYKNIDKEIIWSTDSNLNGYTKTGSKKEL